MLLVSLSWSIPDTVFTLSSVDEKVIQDWLPCSDVFSSFSFQKGDIFFVHNDMGDGWLWVTAHRTGEQGMIFRDLVDDLADNIDPNTVFSWFHPNVTKNEAVDMLVKGKMRARTKAF